ncbi:MAG: HEAT repeat domain-containing protein [Bacteroidetes bacterium]|nr:MAG: HEAT repeat domain-containing protein [Bacteroidota bacterium]
MLQHKSAKTKVITTAIAMIAILNYYTLAQDSLSRRTFKVLTEGLKAKEMNLNDIWLSIDTTENNYHRLKLFDTIFTNPLHSVDVVKEHANFLLNLNETNFDIYFEMVINQLEFRKYQPVYYDNNLSTKDIDGELGFGTDTTFGVEGGQLFRMFISPVIQIKQMLAEDFLCKKGVRLSFLKDNYKGVLLGTGSENSNTGYDSLQKTAKDFFIYSQSADRSMLYSNGISLYKTLLKLAVTARNNIDILKNNIKTTIIETPYGKVALGGAGNDRYEGDFTAILDIGGDDKYIITSSGNGNKSEAKFIVDLSGNDIYQGTDYTLGGAAFGINVLIDIEGNDSYSSDNFSLGCGVFGVGILHDVSGDDNYTGKIMSEGASSFGLGLLFDNSGNDEYDISSFGQGLALSKGFSALVDNFGKDSYHSLFYINPEKKQYLSFAQGVSVGFYPYSSGGIGLLVEGRGNDNYRAGVCGQGFGYWFGLGALYDINGYDNYESNQYSQGASFNSGIGILFDNQGNDSYSSYGIAQGFANDNSFALLLDDFGSDFYSINTQPDDRIESKLPSFSMLIDSYGSSTFSNYLIVDKEMIGKKKTCLPENQKNRDISFYTKTGLTEECLQHNIRDRYGNFNISTGDTSVTDFYSILTLATQDTNKEKQKYDLSQFDFERRLILLHSKIDTSKFNESIKDKSSEDLYNQAMSGTLKVEEIELLKDKITENPSTAEYFAGKLGTESIFERKFIKNILSGLLKKNSLPCKNLLIDSSESKNAGVLMVCLGLMADYKIFDIVKPISELSKSSSWRLRAEAADAIGKIGASTQIDILTELLEDSNPYVRSCAAFSLGELMPEDILNRIHLCFYDDYNLVRKRTFEGITDKRDISLMFILQLFKADIPMSAKTEFAPLITASKFSKKEMKIFQENFYNLPVSIRRIIYKSIYKTGNKIWTKKLKEFRKAETEKELQNLIDKLMVLMKKKGK